jgi:hypothetical protein
MHCCGAGLNSVGTRANTMLSIIKTRRLKPALLCY